jgi:hypothetical protein
MSIGRPSGKYGISSSGTIFETTHYHQVLTN